MADDAPSDAAAVAAPAAAASAPAPARTPLAQDGGNKFQHAISVWRSTRPPPGLLAQNSVPNPRG
jgi:hypothetical protein